MTGLSPNSAVAGTATALTLTVTGTGFVTGSVVYFGDLALPTTDTSATSLTATVPVTALARPRTVSVVVSNGRGSGGSSNATAFTVTPASPAPTVTTLSPSSAVAGSGALTLTVTGTNFLSSSVVYFGNTSLTPTAETSTSLTVTIPATAITHAGRYGVVVSNGPSSGYSSPALFTVTPANAPTVTALSPNSVVAGTATALTLTVTGTGFVTGSVVYFGDLALPTSDTSATSLTATVPVTALARPRTVSVVVSNGRGSGGQSNATSFTITPSSPAPTVTTLSPSSVVAGSGPLTLALTGTGFTSASVVSLGRQALTTTFVDATHVTAAVPAQATAYPEQFPATVSNGASSGPSNAVTFTVTPPTAQVFYLIGRRGNAANAGIAVAYQAAPSATPALDFTQPLSLSVATTATPPVPVFAAGPVTLTPETYTPRGGASVTYYQYRSQSLLVTVVPQASGQYAVELEALGVNLTGVDPTLPVAVTLDLAGQTFTAQRPCPVTKHGFDFFRSPTQSRTPSTRRAAFLCIADWALQALPVTWCLHDEFAKARGIPASKTGSWSGPSRCFN